eukprot:544985_1
MTECQQLQFTEDGFPTPGEDVYHNDELVWVLVDQDLPYWPGQIKIKIKWIFNSNELYIIVYIFISAIAVHDMNETSINGRKLITVSIFRDPSLTILSSEQIEYNIINEISQKHPRKNALQKERVVSNCKILKWDALKQDGKRIEFDDVIAEFVTRKQYKSVEDIPDAIYDQWNGPALEDAEEEQRRLYVLKENEVKRKQERDQLERARQEEIKKANAMSGQIWDGRRKNNETGELEGFILHAGDKIRYWTINQMNNQNELLTTTIIQLHDKYGTLRAKSTVPVVVEAGLNPPYWDTEIELLPTEDEMNPIYWPLKRCKFVPGEVENVLEIEHRREAREWEERMRKTKFGGMILNTNLNNTDKPMRLESFRNDEIPTLKRRQLQELCKSNGIKANSKTVMLIKELQNKLKKIQNENTNTILNTTISPTQSKEPTSNNLNQNNNENGKETTDESNKRQQNILSLCDSIKNDEERSRIFLFYLSKKCSLDPNNLQSLNEYQKEELTRAIPYLNVNHNHQLFDMMKTCISDSSHTNGIISLDVDDIENNLLIHVYNFVLSAIKQQHNDKQLLISIISRYDNITEELPLKQLIYESHSNISKLQSQYLNDIKIDKRACENSDLLNSIPARFRQMDINFELIKKLHKILYSYSLKDGIIPEHYIQISEVNTFMLQNLSLPQWIECVKCKKWRFVSVLLNDLIDNQWMNDEKYRKWSCSTADGFHNLCDTQQPIPNRKTQNEFEIKILKLQRESMNLDYKIQRSDKNSIHQSQLIEIQKQKNELIREYQLQSVFNNDNLQSYEVEAIYNGIMIWNGYFKHSNNENEIFTFYGHLLSEFNEWDNKMIKMIMDLLGFFVCKHDSVAVPVDISCCKQKMIYALSTFLLYPTNYSLKLSQKYFNSNIGIDNEEHKSDKIEDVENLKLQFNLDDQLIASYIGPGAMEILLKDHSNEELAAALTYMTQNNDVLKKDNVWYNVFAFKSALTTMNATDSV